MLVIRTATGIARTHTLEPNSLSTLQTGRRKGLEPHFLGWHVCRENFGTNDFYLATNFLAKNAPKFPPSFLSLYFVGLQKIPQKSRQIAHKISLRRTYFKIHRRDSAGVQEEPLPQNEIDTKNMVFQDGGKGGLGLRGVAVTTKTATTAKTVKTATVASLCCIFYRKDKEQEGKVLSRTAKPAKTVMKATPLKPNPPFPSS